MINLLIAAYRAFPVRPHCNAAIDSHTALCMLASPLTKDRCKFELPIPD